jgi:organic radical activating enzyme
LFFAVRKRFGNSKTIWLYTGYDIPTLLMYDSFKRFLFSEVNVIVDGPFIKDKHSVTLNYRGSSNQMIRLIDKKDGSLNVYTIYSDDTIDQIKDSRLLVNILEKECVYKLVNEADIPDIIETFISKTTKGN